MVNGVRSVSVNGQSGKDEISSGAYRGDLVAYIRSAFSALSSEGQQAVTPQSIERTTVNGIPAAYGLARVQGSNGQLDVAVFAYEFARDRAYHFLAIAQAGQVSVFNSMFGSMRKISASEAGKVRPRKLAVVTVGPRDTVDSLAARMAYDTARLERFRVLNGLGAGDRVSSGQKVKIVTY